MAFLAPVQLDVSSTSHGIEVHHTRLVNIIATVTALVFHKNYVN